MHITKVELRNFKRFTNLTIDGIPPTTKLVLLIGANGSGKSSVFDAFESINTGTREEGRSAYQAAYLRKNKDEKESVSIAVFPPVDELPPGSFYGRSSFRQVSRLVGRPSDESFSLEKDSDRPKLFIDRDMRFENDINRVSRQIITEIFRGDASGKQIRARYVQPINEALSRIFGQTQATVLALLEIIPPGEGQPAQLNFRKGESEIHYDLLSAGEKEIINILFNLLARKSQFTDAIYFFDEIDLHLNTQLQVNLLREITENWIPDNCQLWTASHSLGFIDYAQQYENGVIIDFDNLDFDQPQTLYPQPKESLEVYDIAVPKEMLFEIMKDKKIIFCENQNDDYYNLLALPKTLFVGLKDARDVFLQIKNDNRSYALRDRDYLSDTEITRLEMRYPHYRILRYYDFENYLYHPDNITELAPANFNRDAYVAEIIRQKNRLFNALLLNLKSARQYEEFKTDEMKDKTEDALVADLQSDDFERFYKFFDMKEKFNKTILTSINLDKKRLVQTPWFRQQIEAILNL